MDFEAILLVAHGDGAGETLQVLKQLAEQLTRRINRPVYAAQLLAPPQEVQLSIVCEDLIQHGFHRIALFPCFLANGLHVSRDIPNQVREIQTRFPKFEVEIFSPFGADSSLVDLLLHRLQSSS
ncbi:MAG TPA: CbiX/SirB N-terminal domain-containing protein [Fibrobacteraceae bacterium]|nr:CbiX/SirB N-terminal domain-containing protein [Fibrobacteraceae bacterium]